MSVADVDVVVIGAGIAGLAAALELQDHFGEVIVVDASDRPGGVMRTDYASGYVFERGPNTFQVKAPMLSFLEARGIDNVLQRATPESRSRYLLRDGKLVRVPTSPFGIVTTRLISGGAKWRLFAEPLKTRQDATGESVSEFSARRFGEEVAEHLVGPFLTGVYAGDETQLGVEAVFPQLVAAERDHGSVTRGLLADAVKRRGPRTKAGSYSARAANTSSDGLGPFARMLAERLVHPPALETDVESIHNDGPCWCVSMRGRAGSVRIRAPRVVVATPSCAAANILRGVSSELASGLEAIAYTPVVSVAIGVDREKVRTPIDGFGFLVPRSEKLGLLGCLYMSRLFPGRAPEGFELLQCLLGGARWPEAIEHPDDVLLEQIRADLDATLGLDDTPKVLGICRWPRAVPQPDREHVRRVAGLRQACQPFPGIALAGSYLDGVGLADSLASGLTAARSLLP